MSDPTFHSGTPSTAIALTVEATLASARGALPIKTPSVAHRRRDASDTNAQMVKRREA
jgi:hypothetical protein